jgi:hypothetical protein
MEDKLQGAIEVLMDELEEQEKQVADTKRTINALLRRTGQAPKFDDPTATEGSRLKIRRDEYYTKPLATAVQMFLHRRREPATAQEIMQGLQQGGFEFKGWKEDDRLRLLASSIGKNTKAFHKVPSGAFGLVEWYDLQDQDETEEDPKPTAKRAAAASAGATDIPEAEGKSTGEEKKK